MTEMVITAEMVINMRTFYACETFDFSQGSERVRNSLVKAKVRNTHRIDAHTAIHTQGLLCTNFFQGCHEVCNTAGSCRFLCLLPLVVCLLQCPHYTTCFVSIKFIVATLIQHLQTRCNRQAAPSIESKVQGSRVLANHPSIQAKTAKTWPSNSIP